MNESVYDIFDNMIEGVQIIDPEWNYKYVNHTVAKHGKKKREELVGKKMMEVYPGIEQTAMFDLLKQCMSRREYMEMINEFDFPDGSKGYFELRMEPVPDGVLILSFDITSLKRAEQTLKDINTELEEKVRERTSELTLRNKELEQFAYVASHDLQEPLRSIMGFARILEDNYKDSLDELGEKSLSYITRASIRMKNLIVALLEYSKLGNTGTKQETDIGNLLQDVLSDLDARIKDRNAVIEIGEMPKLFVHTLEFHMLLQNLIDNALKYCPADRQPVVRISAEKKDGENWEFSVADNGIGMEEEHLERIFLIFQRLHTQEEFNGTGIGLAQCRKIAEFHGGDIWVKSAVGKGSTFYFNVINTN